MKFDLETTNPLSKESKSDLNLNHSKQTCHKATELFKGVLCGSNIFHFRTRNYHWNVIASCTAIVLSFITLLTLINSQLMVNNSIQVVYGLGTQFSIGTYNHTGLEQNTRAFLDNLQQKGGHQFTPCRLTRLVPYYPVFRLVILFKNFQLISRILPSQEVLIQKGYLLR